MSYGLRNTGWLQFRPDRPPREAQQPKTQQQILDEEISRTATAVQIEADCA